MRQSNAGDWSFLDFILGVGEDVGVYTVPGDGTIDYVKVFRALKGYSGWVVLEAEQDPKKAPALPYAKKGVAEILVGAEGGGADIRSLWRPIGSAMDWALSSADPRSASIVHWRPLRPTLPAARRAV